MRVSELTKAWLQTAEIGALNGLTDRLDWVIMTQRALTIQIAELASKLDALQRAGALIPADRILDAKQVTGGGVLCLYLDVETKKPVECPRSPTGSHVWYGTESGCHYCGAAASKDVLRAFDTARAEKDPDENAPR